MKAYEKALLYAIGLMAVSDQINMDCGAGVMISNMIIFVTFLICAIRYLVIGAIDLVSKWRGGGEE